MSDPLTPVREVLLERARTDAERTLASATAEADKQVRRARGEAEALLREAKEQGLADAARILAGEDARAHREARAAETRARAVAYGTFREALVAALCKEFPAWRAGLVGEAEHVLGGAVTVTGDPAGGFVARRGDRRVWFTAEALADAVIERLGAKVARLWGR
jgi:vacuolar-type H+-ATPase subunit H